MDKSIYTINKGRSIKRLLNKWYRKEIGFRFLFNIGRIINNKDFIFKLFFANIKYLLSAANVLEKKPHPTLLGPSSHVSRNRNVPNPSSPNPEPTPKHFLQIQAAFFLSKRPHRSLSSLSLIAPIVPFLFLTAWPLHQRHQKYPCECYKYPTLSGVSAFSLFSSVALVYFLRFLTPVKMPLLPVVVVSRSDTEGQIKRLGFAECHTSQAERNAERPEVPILCASFPERNSEHLNINKDTENHKHRLSHSWFIYQLSQNSKLRDG